MIDMTPSVCTCECVCGNRGRRRVVTLATRRRACGSSTRLRCVCVMLIFVYEVPGLTRHSWTGHSPQSLRLWWCVVASHTRYNTGFMSMVNDSLLPLRLVTIPPRSPVFRVKLIIVCKCARVRSVCFPCLRGPVIWNLLALTFGAEHASLLASSRSGYLYVIFIAVKQIQKEMRGRLQGPAKNCIKVCL